MTNPDYTHIQLVVDRSGSMSNIKDDMNKGMAEFLKTQAEAPGKLTIGVTRFDTVIDHLIEPDGTIESLDGMTLVEPRGGTALNDGIGIAVTHLGEHLAAMKPKDRPGTVIVMVVTDGEENSSREYSVQSVKDLIEKQKDKYSWEFMFLGANLDAQKTAGGYGIPKSHSINYSFSGNGAVYAASVASSVATRSRGGDHTGFTQEEREGDTANAVS